MAERSDRLAVRVRIVNDAQLAAYLGRSVSWLTGHRRELEQTLKFPPRLPVVGGNDLNAVDRWIDQLLDPDAAIYDRNFEQAWLEAASNEPHQGPVTSSPRSRRATSFITGSQARRCALLDARPGAWPRPAMIWARR